MKIIELDLTGCKYAYDIHKRIQVAFDGTAKIGVHFGICSGVNAMQIRLL